MATVAKKTIKIVVLKCNVCGYEWQPRAEKAPVKCPNQRCQSYRWNDPKQTSAAD